MPGLTVSEKTALEGPDRRADRRARVEAIKAEHPALFDRVKREAHGQALASLGLSGPYAELEAVQAEEAALARRKKRAQRAMLAALKGVPVEEVSDTSASATATSCRCRPRPPRRSGSGRRRTRSGSWPTTRSAARSPGWRPRGRACWTWCGWRPRRPRSAPCGRRSARCWATSRRAWSARRSGIEPIEEV